MRKGAAVKLLFPILVLLVGVLPALAQMHQPPPFHSLGGWGSVAFPGTGHPPSSGYVNQGSRAGHVELRGGADRYNRPYRPAYSRNAYPVYYPVYVGGYSEAPPPEPSYGSAYGPAPAPTVIINQNFAAPSEPAAPVETVHVYSGARPPADNPAPDPQYYLIALKDHSIYSAVAYWVEAGTLRYITSPNIRNETSLDLVDLGLTAKLNQDRGVIVSLPPAH